MYTYIVRRGMGASSSKHPCGVIKTAYGERLDQLKMFQRFFQEFIEIQPIYRDEGMPWVLPLTQISAAYYTYLYSYIGFPKPVFCFGGFDSIVYSCMKQHVTQLQCQKGFEHVALLGFVCGIRDPSYTSVMLSGMRLCKIPVGIAPTVCEDTHE